MAKQIEGVYERLLECAKKEFLEKGFEGASLRTIAQAANTSTNSIYVRFKDKGGIFEALVHPAAEELKSMIYRIQHDFSCLKAKEQLEQSYQYGTDSFPEILTYIYDNFDVFKLLLTCSYGTPYSDFIHDLSVIDAGCYKRYIEQTGAASVIEENVSDNLLHILSSGFYSSLLEMVVHNLSREEAEKDLVRLREFYKAGWETILGKQDKGFGSK
ncbi:TetR family transcriptional regulator [Ruminiclostridium sufflavum DSM 19573]|uniref:TetR family transcriptional regulator n=1 Tax=Ruminiclostridium sufflavum DSM 19573 TaxID=1121337 RepID=A0A318XRH4_9FIRM|nr:TetR/AcrR family transcriptional regulator [Ruminiclostridium sufflavum]PYG90259.1 TetR family transcriptional regulator [Ruminiclostridium sufflavum DSM 19573]